MRVPAITTREQVVPPYQHIYDEIAASRGGALTGPFWALLYSPVVAGRTAALGAYVRYESSLPERVHTVAAMTVARALDCHYEWTVNENGARRAGLTDDEIAALRDRRAPGGLNGDDVLVFQFANQLMTKHRVDEPTWHAMEARYGLKIVADVCAAIGYYSHIAMVMNAFEVMPPPDRPSTLPV